MHRIDTSLILITAALTLALGAGTAGAGSMRSPSTGAIGGDWDIDTRSQGAEAQQSGSLGNQFFHVQWSAVPDAGGRAHIAGYVYDDYGQPAVDVELRVTMLDTDGHETGFVTVPVRGLVPAEGDAYFDAAVPDSPAYRVSVAEFDLVEFGPGG